MADATKTKRKKRARLGVAHAMREYLVQQESEAIHDGDMIGQDAYRWLSTCLEAACRMAERGLNQPKLKIFNGGE